MEKLLFILLLLMPLNAYVIDEPIRLKKISILDSVYYQILKNKPDIDKIFAFRFAGLLEKYAKINNMDPHRAAAIAMQESTYRKYIVSKNRTSSDYGIFQLNTRTIQEYGIDKKRLLTDLEYSVSTYFIVMKDKKKVCERLKQDAWSCYHSKTPSLRLKYKKLVNQYYHSDGRKSLNDVKSKTGNS